MVNDIVKYFGLLIISLLFPLLTIACKDTDDGVRIPDNWIEISTDKIEFAYEGGQDIRNFQLVTGIDESELQVSLSNGGDDWLTVTTQNGRLQVLCERSYVERERSATLTLSYDDNHQCGISVAQAKFFKAWGFLCPVDTKLNDYGTKEFIITQEEINQLIEEINDCNYKRPHTEVYLITDANYQDFK